MSRVKIMQEWQQGTKTAVETLMRLLVLQCQNDVQKHKMLAESLLISKDMGEIILDMSEEEVKEVQQQRVVAFKPYQVGR